MAQLILPMAGKGERFLNAGYGTPKPLLQIHDVPMYQLVLANLLHPCVTRIVTVAQKSQLIRRQIHELGQRLGIEVVLVELDGYTKGAAVSVEAARDWVDPSLPAVVANSDQYVDASLDAFWDATISGEYAGCILAMEDDDPKWSYVVKSSDDLAITVKEKQVISQFATVGIYGFGRAEFLYSSIAEMRSAGDTTNGEFYVAPAYNYLIGNGARVKVSNLGPVNSVMHGLGVPADYVEFCSKPVSHRAARIAQNVLG